MSGEVKEIWLQIAGGMWIAAYYYYENDWEWYVEVT
jgi:hypothetical protein